MELVNVADLVNPATGKTYREENKERSHAIPIGELVEFKLSQWHGDGCCQKIHARMWVVLHSRDCDGTPLYGVSKWKDPSFAKQVNEIIGGLDEASLTTIKVTAELGRGEDALQWEEDNGNVATVD